VEHSTKTGSFIVTNAWSGVLVGTRRIVQVSRLGASKVTIVGFGIVRRQTVYRPRRQRSSPVLVLYSAVLAPLNATFQRPSGCGG
jgi:hypothetical protein